MDSSLPIKTDKDTLREGYRSEPCLLSVPSATCACGFGKLISASLYFYSCKKVHSFRGR
jgi:hypothetical protein